MSMSAISLSGMQASMVRMTASASNVANVASQGNQPVRAVLSDVAGGGVSARIEASGAAEVDLTDQMVEMLVAKIAFQANAKMLATAHDLERGLVDRLA